MAGALGSYLAPEVVRAWPEEEARVRRGSPELASIIDGHAIGPADADAYVRASCTAHLVFDRFQFLTEDPVGRSEVITTLFQDAYRQTRAAFRPETKCVLETVLARGLSVHVVTNADPVVVTDKLAGLAPAGLPRLRVRGDARKFLIGPPSRPDPRFAALPAERRLPGLARPLLLQRGRYFDVLTSIWAESGAGPAETLVCGDIFELDLALPAELGAHVHLVRRETTYAYETDAVAALGARGGVGEGLAGSLERCR